MNVIVFAVIIALYFVTGFAASHFAVQRGFFEILGRRMPLASLAGVFSSVSNIFLITLVVFYGKLTEEEFNEIKKHTIWGWEILSNIVQAKARPTSRTPF